MGESFWQKIIKSFDPNFLGKAASRSLKEGLKYLLLLLLFISFILSLRYTIGFSIKVKNLLREFPNFLEKFKDFPEITIQEGKILSPKEKIIKKWEGFIFIIDPAGEASEYLSFMGNYPEGLVIIPNKVMIKFEKEKIEIYDISEIPYFNFKFNQEKEKLFTLNFAGKTFQPTFKEINRWMNITFLALFPLFFLFFFFSSLVNKFFQIFLLSLLSLIVNKTKKAGLKYQNLLTIGIFALTPPLILETFVKLIGITIPYFGFGYYLFYAILLISGILKSSTSST